MGFFKSFFKPRWMNEADVIAVEGVKDVDDPETLRQIVAEAPSSAARIAALEKLDDPALYREVALTSKEWRLIEGAMRHVDDVETLEAVRDRRILVSAELNRRIYTLKHEALTKQILEVSSMKDIARLVQLATADPAKDELKMRDSRWGDLNYPLPWTEEGNLRKAAVVQIASLGDDAALAQVITHAADRIVIDLAASKIADQQVLEGIALEGDGGGGWLGLVIRRMDNAALLRTLKHPAAMVRLCDLPCIDGRDHDWFLIREDRDDPYADVRIDLEVHQCFKCDIVRERRIRVC